MKRPCSTNDGKSFAVLDFTQETLAFGELVVDDGDSRILIQSVDEASLLSGSLSEPINLDSLQEKEEGESVRNLIFQKPGGDLIKADFSKLRGRWGLYIEKGVLYIQQLVVSDLFPDDEEPSNCSDVSYKLGARVNVNDCTQEPTGFTSFISAPKCCCDNYNPLDQANLATGNVEPTITVTSSLDSVTFGDTGPVFTAVVDNAEEVVTFEIVSGEGTLTVLTDLTARYNPSEDDEGTTIEVSASIDQYPEYTDSDTCDVEAPVPEADEFVAIRFEAADLMQLTSGTEDMIDYLTTEDGIDHTVTLDWDYDSGVYEDVTFSGSPGSTTRILGKIMSFQSLCPDVDLSGPLGYASESTICAAATIQYTGGTLGTIGWQGQIFAIQTENYIISVKLQVTGVSTVGYMVNVFNLSTFVSTDSSVYSIPTGVSHIIGIDIDAVAPDGFTLKLFSDANLDETISITGTTQLGVVNNATPFPGGGNTGNGIEIAWDEFFLHQPSIPILGFNT